MGMDPELTDSLRLKGIRRANRLLADSAVHKFIEMRFLRPGRHEGWDSFGALRFAHDEKLGLVERLYSILDGDLLVRLADETTIWAREHGFNSVEGAVAVDNAFDSGLAAAIATAVHDNDQSRSRAEIFLARNAGWDRRLAAHLIHRFFSTNAPPRMAAVAKEEDDDQSITIDADIVASVRGRVSQLLDDFNSRRRRRGHRTRPETGGAELLPAILVQLEWITHRFEAGHARAAWNDVVDLVRRQLVSGDPDKLAMSLTSLATRLSSQEGVPSALCDLAAMCAPDDPAIPTARAELSRTRGRLDEALAVYDRAVEEFPMNVVARNGRAETLRALGCLDEALVAYDRTVEEFPREVVVRNGRAEALRALGRLDEALAVYDRTVEEFPMNVVARNGRAVVLSELGRFDEARVGLKSVVASPRTYAEWVAVHILCMIDFNTGATTDLAERLEISSVKCPFASQRTYFETTLAVVQLAFKRTREVRRTLQSLGSRPELSRAEFTALQLMEVHAEATAGDLELARRTLAGVPNVVPYEQFRLRRIRQEIEHRFGLGSVPAPTAPDVIFASEKKLVQYEMAFWVDCASRKAA